MPLRYVELPEQPYIPNYTPLNEKNMARNNMMQVQQEGQALNYHQNMMNNLYEQTTSRYSHLGEEASQYAQEQLNTVMGKNEEYLDNIGTRGLTREIDKNARKFSESMQPLDQVSSQMQRLQGAIQDSETMSAKMKDYFESQTKVVKDPDTGEFSMQSPVSQNLLEGWKDIGAEVSTLLDNLKADTVETDLGAYGIQVTDDGTYISQGNPQATQFLNTVRQEHLGINKGQIAALNLMMSDPDIQDQLRHEVIANGDDWIIAQSEEFKKQNPKAGESDIIAEAMHMRMLQYAAPEAYARAYKKHTIHNLRENSTAHGIYGQDLPEGISIIAYLTRSGEIKENSSLKLDATIEERADSYEQLKEQLAEAGMITVDDNGNIFPVEGYSGDYDKLIGLRDNLEEYEDRRNRFWEMANAEHGTDLSYEDFVNSVEKELNEIAKEDFIDPQFASGRGFGSYSYMGADYRAKQLERIQKNNPVFKTYNDLLKNDAQGMVTPVNLVMNTSSQNHKNMQRVAETLLSPSNLEGSPVDLMYMSTDENNKSLFSTVKKKDLKDVEAKHIKYLGYFVHPETGQVMGAINVNSPDFKGTFSAPMNQSITYNVGQKAQRDEQYLTLFNTVASSPNRRGKFNMPSVNTEMLDGEAKKLAEVSIEAPIPKTDRKTGSPIARGNEMYKVNYNVVQNGRVVEKSNRFPTRIAAINYLQTNVEQPILDQINQRQNASYTR